MIFHLKSKDILFLFFTFTLVYSQGSVPCQVLTKVSNSLMEKWDFNIPNWANTRVRYATDQYNVPPMTGQWIYELNFCQDPRIYMGSTVNNTQDLLGWSYGPLSNFEVIQTITPIAPPSQPTPAPTPNTIPRKRFVQTYSGGDSGPPCAVGGRSAVVNLYCGDNSTSCGEVPNSPGNICLSGTLSEGYCLCAAGFNTTLGFQGTCTSLWFNILSRSCPNFEAIHITNPTMPPATPNIAAAVIASLIGIFAFCYILGYIYNYTVHTKRGAEALPFYDTCAGASSSRSTVQYSGLSS